MFVLAAVVSSAGSCIFGSFRFACVIFVTGVVGCSEFLWSLLLDHWGVLMQFLERLFYIVVVWQFEIKFQLIRGCPLS